MAELKSTGLLVLPSPSHRRSFPQPNLDNISIANPPIFKLHDDLLWLIFWLNADMEGEAQGKDEIAAIDTLRYSSQVCSGWRQIILSFPSLWGQVVNLSHLEQDDWREEVLRRTGKSLLSVLWGSQRQACLSVDVAAGLLRRHWGRIRSLDFNFTSSYYTEGFNIAQFWEIFCRPSEVLEIFRVIFERVDRECTPILSPSNFVVFNNVAPALRVFYAPNIEFNLDAPWLENLRYLALSGPVSAYKVVQAIQHMPRLECLVDGTFNAIASTGDSLSSQPQISAPSIKEIVLVSHSDLGPYMDFLAQIKPAAGCYLTFRHTGVTFNAKALALASRVVYNYSRCCDLPSAIDICLDLYCHRFIFMAQIPRKGQFCFRLTYFIKLRREIFEALFEALPSVKFPDVKTLMFGISPLFLKPSDRRIAQFILSVPSVETLATNPETLGFLLNLPSDVLALSFPVLHTVKFARSIQPEELSNIKQFLTSRISTGRPVDILSFPLPTIDRGFDTDLRSLDEFTGLTIILQYGDHENKHICGVSHINNLFIRRIQRRVSESPSSESSSEGE
ncbi:hypothetical protein GALMADRAFT_259878 [Galerina marginata CBS 339.88]|uniref:F-box domain-containing protein n=1 Tax=Galerina marginata (strain CBS 339.88) TaxID=685588 RepID=A0A067S7Y6_GALM3|nr:hypothetical protein GALMADRAFT_259878 [Galerina marginata CBS 339.88]